VTLSALASLLPDFIFQVCHVLSPYVSIGGAPDFSSIRA